MTIVRRTKRANGVRNYLNRDMGMKTPANLSQFGCCNARTTGLTLLELLTVVAVIGILASLLLPVLNRVRSKAHQVGCIHNLRQHGIALENYRGNHGAYPLQFDHEARNRWRNWEGALFPETLSGDPNNIPDPPPMFDCPAAHEPEAFANSSAVYKEYGYNGQGLGGRAFPKPLGLGGYNNGVTHYATPVKVAEVLNPAHMIAIGDGFDGWNGRIQDGKTRISRTPGAADLSTGHRQLLYGNARQRAEDRHRGEVNILFADGHVEPLALDFLFSNQTDAALRIWNRDHQPHRERLDP